MAVLVLVFVIGMSVGRAEAQGVDLRAGVSAEPDQFYFGLGYETAELLERLRFRPNLEIGVGNDETLTTANFEFAYRIPIQKKPWHVYVGGGPALVIRTHNGTDVGGGFNILLGVAHRRGLFTEIKVGAIDSPSFKFGVGYRLGS